MKEDSLSTKEMLLNIGSMRKKALEFAQNGKRYNALLAEILAEDFYYDEDGQVPSLKELVMRTGLNSSKIRKYIGEIYHDLVLNWETRPVFSITKVRYEIYVKGFGNKPLTFELEHLPVLPRVGEDVSFPFFTAYLGHSHYYVEDIKHAFEEDAQIITIWLRYGNFNLYWHYRKDKAEEEGELDFRDILEKDDYDLKRKLKVGRWGRIQF